MVMRLTPAVKALLIACAAAFVVQQTADQFFGANLLGWFALVPAEFMLHYRFWQILTYPFLHGDVMHLVLNMMMLVFIGGELEGSWGTAKFLRFYFLCSTAAGLLYLAIQVFISRSEGLYVPMLGASGGIYGLLMAYGILYGERTMLFMMMFPMKAKHFIWILAGVEFFSTVFNGRNGLAGAAHLGGMVAGFSLLWGGAIYRVAKKRRAEKGPRKDPRKRPGKKSDSQHLKLVINNDPEAGGGGDTEEADDPPKTWH